MSDTITTTSTRMMRADMNVAVPVGTRVRCVTLEGSSVLQSYVGEIGTIVSHEAGRAPLVKFPLRRSGDNTWYVTSWNVLPAEGQRVTVAECLELAQQEFKDWATGREVTYLSTDSNGHHRVRFDTVPNAGTIHEYPNPANVEHVEFTLGGPVEALPEREPDQRTYAVRDREARRKFEALVEAINDLAEEQDWCGNFEEWCERVGIESRRRRDKEFNVTVELTYEIDSDTVERIFREQFRGEHDDVDVDSVTVTSTVVITVTTTEDNPGEMDSYDFESHLADAGYTGWNDWSIKDYEESC